MSKPKVLIRLEEIAEQKRQEVASMQRECLDLLKMPLVGANDAALRTRRLAEVAGKMAYAVTEVDNLDSVIAEGIALWESTKGGQS